VHLHLVEVAREADDVAVTVFPLVALVFALFALVLGALLSAVDRKIQKMQIQALKNTYRRHTHAHTHTHTHTYTRTPTQKHMHTTPSES
jgi:tetrahydromethanopterin S-methyltransferase subunit C